jgi:hypothetical protein
MQRLQIWLLKVTKMDCKVTENGFKVSKEVKPAVTVLFEFLREQIPVFVQQADARLMGLSEDVITDIFVRFCSEAIDSSIYPFYFHKESLEDDTGRSRRNDFAVLPKSGQQPPTLLLPSEVIAVARFEAKRLADLGKLREREYVHGEYKNGLRHNNSGGIERFKNKSHGERENNSALIGYIQTDDTKTWHARINQWIDDQIVKPSDPALSWTSSDKLQRLAIFPYHEEFESTSERLTLLAPINLRHFWIPLNLSKTDT